MSYTPPVDTIEVSWAGQDAYSAPSGTIAATWSDNPRYVAPPGVPAKSSGAPGLIWEQFIAPPSVPQSVVAERLWALFPKHYRTPQFIIDASWLGRDVYAPPIATFTATWADVTYIAPLGLDAPEFPDPVTYQTQFAAPDGWVSHSVGDHFALHPWEYAPPEWTLDVTWLGRDEYQPAIGVLDGLWTLPSESKYLPVTGWNSLTVGTATAERMLEYLTPPGLVATAFGDANLALSAAAIYPNGLASPPAGTPTAYNLRQYLQLTGYSALRMGSEAFVAGGVKHVTYNGKDMATIGHVSVINTTADQTAKPGSIAAPVVPQPDVSPRMLYPAGVPSPGPGIALVQRNPSPTGFETLRWGELLVDYKTKFVTTDTILSPDPGYPRVFDPTQEIQAPSLTQQGIFGDTQVSNVSLVVAAVGFDALELSAWATVASNRRSVLADGWNSLVVGTTGIHNKTPSLAPPGLDALGAPSEIGTAVGYAIRYIVPRGLTTMVFGVGELTKPPEIAPSGIAGALGAPTVWHRVRTLEAQGSNAQDFGAASIWFRYRYVPTAGFAADKYGTPKAEHGRRTLLANGGAHAAYGRPTVTNSDRTVSPEGIFEDFATDHMVGGLRFLNPPGFDPARFGTRIIPEIQDLYPLGFTGRYGLPVIWNETQLVVPPSITTGVQPADRWGTAKIFNSRQFITLFYDPDSQLNPPAWPKWTLIQNRNKEMRTAGHLSERVAIPGIFNNARPIYPPAIMAPANPEHYEAGLIAYRIREVALQGLEAPYMSAWARAYNSAAVVSPQGDVASLYGAAAVDNTRRYFPYIGNFDTSRYGYPLIADRIRTLEFEGRYTIHAPVIPPPEVKLFTRYVQPIGEEMFGSGWASLSIHRTLITPRWTHQERFGWAEVTNLTPEIGGRGRNSEAFGHVVVRLQWRPVAPLGTSMQLFGPAVIADRDRTLHVNGLRAGAIGDKLKVIKTGAPPYSTQYIYLDSVTIDGQEQEGHGIEPPGGKQANIQVPMPIINQQVLYVHQEEPSTRFGTALVRANTVRVEPGYQDLLVGDPMVALRVRTVVVESWPDSKVPPVDKPRLSPHTVWAMMEAPEQAKRNHPTALPLHPIDGYSRQPGAIFGATRLTLQNRLVRGQGQSRSDYGRPTIQLHRRYLVPNGFTSQRMGWHSIPGTRELVEFDSPDATALGRPTIAPPPYTGPQTLKEQGADSLTVGGLLIEHLNREIRVSGHLSQQMGTLEPGDTPYQWQGLRIGPLMPTIPDGFDAEAWGESWVSFRVREMKPVGFDAFLSEYQLEEFDKRMRVWRRETPRPSVAVGPVGFSAFASTASDVRPGARFIRPDGNSDQHRKGAF